MFMELCSKWLDTVGKKRFPLMSVHEEVMIQEFAAWLNKQAVEQKLETDALSPFCVCPKDGTPNSFCLVHGANATGRSLR